MLNSVLCDQNLTKKNKNAIIHSSQGIGRKRTQDLNNRFLEMIC